MRGHFQIFLGEFQPHIHKSIDWVGEMSEEGGVEVEMGRHTGQSKLAELLLSSVVQIYQ